MVTGEGLGGNTYAKLVRTKIMRIGDANVARPVAQLSADTAGMLASASYAGVIGTDVLKCFTATFDYARSALYLAPRSPDCPQPFDRTGATVEKTDGKGYAVEGVLANGPAALAGLRAGDRIVAIDGRPASRVNTQQWWELAHAAPGTRMSLSVQRGQAV